MPLQIKPGTRLFSAVSAAEMIAVKAPDHEIDLTLGGVAPLLDAADRGEPEAIAEGHGGAIAMGKRYVDDDESIELLCTKPGDGVPALRGTPLQLKAAKALPASD